MLKKLFATVIVLGTLSLNAYADLSPNTTCNDGTWSNSRGSGTCSWHGGVKRY